jgi:hypothetical protein
MRRGNGESILYSLFVYVSKPFRTIWLNWLYAGNGPFEGGVGVERNSWGLLRRRMSCDQLPDSKFAKGIARDVLWVKH